MHVARDSGVVDENVDGAQSGRDLLEERRHLGFVRDVAAAGPRPPAARDDCGFELARGLLTLAKGDADRRAALRQRLHDRAADAARASGDDGDSTGETQFIARWRTFRISDHQAESA